MFKEKKSLPKMKAQKILIKKFDQNCRNITIQHCLKIQVSGKQKKFTDEEGRVRVNERK